jgi:F0F1-type ATP synthase membrane subunit b/b'
MTILVREIVEKVIGKSVDERQHEELVIQAIEEAKQDGIL